MTKEIKVQTQAAGKPPEIKITTPTNDTLCLRLSGDCRIGQSIPSLEKMEKRLESDPKIQKITFDTSEIADWNSSLLTFLMDIHNECSKRNNTVGTDGLPIGVQKLIALATAVPERKGARRQIIRDPFLVRIGALSPPHALLFQYFLQVLMLKTLLFQYFLEVVFATTLTYGKHTRIDSHIGQQCRTVHAGNLI